MKIPVIFADGTPGVANADELEGLIHTRRIVSFRRSSGWVKIGKDTLRGVSQKGAYNSRERRETQ